MPCGTSWVAILAAPFAANNMAMSPPPPRPPAKHAAPAVSGFEWDETDLAVLYMACASYGGDWRRVSAKLPGRTKFEVDLVLNSQL